MKLKITWHWIFLLTLLMAMLSACTPEEEAPSILVVVRADGREQTYRHTEPVTVAQFLREIDLELGVLDRINPAPVTQITDQMIITVRRVEEREECIEQAVPYPERIVIFEGLAPGEESIAQAGENGIEQVCERVTFENGVETGREPIRTISLVPPREQIINVGPTTELEPVSISGTLAYLSNGNAWIIRGSNNNRRNLTTDGNLDPTVFSLSRDGLQLIFATIPDDDEIYNQVWLINDTTLLQPTPIELPIQDVRYAEWRPGHNNTIAYSTLEITETTPGWNAYNDLWLITIDPQSGTTIRIEEVLTRSQGGLYGYWGTFYSWSADGEQVIWIRADAVGLVDLDEGELSNPLLEYALLTLQEDFSWRTTVSWSPDSQLIAATVHGPPAGNESRETSPVFNIAVASTDGTFTAQEMIERAGIWANPTFSPEITDPNSQFPRGYLAYFQAQQWENSLRQSQYNLVVADRDGSNARAIFPLEGLSGLSTFDAGQQLAWSPDGRQIAFIYQGNLWIIDVESGVAHQMTIDGGASNPVWVQ